MTDFKKDLLYRLFSRRIIGGKHTAFEHVMRGFPKHYADKAKEAAKELIKEGLILVKHTNYGLQISLNPERIDEVVQIIDAF